MLPHRPLESDVGLDCTCECLSRRGEEPHDPRDAMVPYGHIHGTFLGIQHGAVLMHAWNLHVHHQRSGEETADGDLQGRSGKNWDLDAPFGLHVLQKTW